jgi:hypothetical protein
VSKQTKRVQMEMPEAAYERLAWLKEKTEAASYAEVTKNAYRLYARLIEMAESGDELYRKDAGGNMTRLEVFL